MPLSLPAERREKVDALVEAQMTGGVKIEKMSFNAQKKIIDGMLDAGKSVKFKEHQASNMETYHKAVEYIKGS